MVLGSKIRDPEKPIPDPGSRGQKGTGSRGQKGTGARIRIRNIARKIGTVVVAYRYLEFARCKNLQRGNSNKLFSLVQLRRLYS